jgi:hypothetical protein
VLARIGGEKNVTIKKIMAFCTAEGMDITLGSLRDQLWVYVKNGLLIRVVPGVFKLGPKGVAITAEVRSGETHGDSRTVR